MGDWYWIGVAAGLGVAIGVFVPALIGASRPEQIEENARAAAGAGFSDEELRRIDGVLRD